jgi:hypothetical protein
VVDDLQRASEIMGFMVYVGEWRGGFGGGITVDGRRGCSLLMVSLLMVLIVV